MRVLIFDVLLYCLRWILGPRVNPNSNLQLKKKQTESCTVSDSADFGLVAWYDLVACHLANVLDKSKTRLRHRLFVENGCATLLHFFSFADPWERLGSILYPGKMWRAPLTITHCLGGLHQNPKRRGHGWWQEGTSLRDTASQCWHWRSMTLKDFYHHNLPGRSLF